MAEQWTPTGAGPGKVFLELRRTVGPHINALNSDVFKLAPQNEAEAVRAEIVPTLAEKISGNQFRQQD